MPDPVGQNQGIMQTLRAFGNRVKSQFGKLGSNKVGQPAGKQTMSSAVSEVTEKKIPTLDNTSSKKISNARTADQSPSKVKQSMKGVADAVRNFFSNMKTKHQAKAIDRELATPRTDMAEANKFSSKIETLAEKWNNHQTSEFEEELGKLSSKDFEIIKEGLSQKIDLSPKNAQKLSTSFKAASDQIAERANTLTEMHSEINKMENPEKIGTLIAKADIPASERENLANSVMAKAKTPQIQAQIIKAALSQEISTHTEGTGTLLRGNSVGTKMLKAFTKQNFVPHLKKSEKFKKVLNELPETSIVKIDDKTRIKSIDDKQLSSIEKPASEILSVVSDIVKNDSPELKAFFDMCTGVKNAANTKFGSPAGNITAINNLFLRSINPVITSPSVNGEINIKYEGDQQKNAILLSKIVQNLANRVFFGEKEKHMEGFNTWLTENRSQMDDIEDHVFG